jgi:UDP-N-acetylmuramoyl-L-alanyl-D-glutamate--2,6-diaminopimelate ligase
MQVHELLKGLEILEAHGDPSVEINSIVYDSRKARRGSLFVCIEGYVTDGHRYINQALEQDASAILVQKPVGDLNVPWFRIADTRRGLAHVSDLFFNHPSGRLSLIGITGTKGKTTATYMTKAIFDAAQHRTGLIGTVANIIGDEITFASRTTPESYDLQALLDEMCDRGLKHCVMEVSSQGLMLERVYGCHFTSGIFTNLFHDHIGPTEHATMDDYLAAKLRLFTQCQHAVINRDIDCFSQVRAAVGGSCLTYGLTDQADIRAEDIKKTTRHHRIGTSFNLQSPWYRGEVFVGMPGLFNVYNALAAIAAAGLEGVGLEAVRSSLSMISVPGRVQPVPTGRPFQVIVDYAHNAASLENLLNTLREYTTGRLVVLFGNGGDRARSRRFEMGEVAGRLADLTVITSDNPRTEEPLAIIDDILIGLNPTGGQYVVIPDRREAIFRSVGMAQPGDMIIIAGKGHENYQIFKDRTIHFDDAETAAEAIAALEPETDGQV